MSTPFNNDQASLPLTQAVVLSGSLGGGISEVGSIRTFSWSASLLDPTAGLSADGQLLLNSANPGLFATLGTTYGGDATHFALPNLDARTAIGVGQGPGLSDHPLGDATGSAAPELSLAQLPASIGGGGQPFDNDQPSLPVEYLIRIFGYFPYPDSFTLDGFIGQVVAFAGNSVPADCLVADGQELSIAENAALFEIIGTTYG